MENNFYEELKAAMANKTKDEILEQWEKSKEFDSIGPTVTEFVRMSNSAINVSKQMFSDSKPMSELQNIALNKTLKRVSKRNPTLPGRL